MQHVPPWVVVTMRKARVWKDDFTGSWRVQSGSLLLDPDSVAARCATHAEAMFLAQLLVDPHEYIRAAQERAWHGGKSVGRIQEYFAIPAPTSRYRKED